MVGASNAFGEANKTMYYIDWLVLIFQLVIESKSFRSSYSYFVSDLKMISMENHYMTGRKPLFQVKRNKTIKNE